MTYRQQLQLVLNTSTSDSPDASSGAAEVSLCSSNEEMPAQHPRVGPSISIKNLFIQVLNGHLRLSAGNILRPAKILRRISTIWIQAISISKEIQALNRHHLVDVLTIPEELAASVKAPLLLPALKTKIAITFSVTISIRDGQTGPGITVTPRASVVYGNRFDEEKMGAFLASILQRQASGAAQKPYAGSGRWVDAVRALSAALLAQGQKGKSGSG